MNAYKYIGNAYKCIVCLFVYLRWEFKMDILAPESTYESSKNFWKWKIEDF